MPDMLVRLSCNINIDMRIFSHIASAVLVLWMMTAVSCEKKPSNEELPELKTCQVLKDRELSSQVLGRTVRFNVMLPPDFSEDGKYNVIYLLHGMGDDNRAWSESPQIRGQVNSLAFELGQMITEGAIAPTVIIMPQAWNSFYLDSSDAQKYIGGFGDLMDYETFFHEELMPHVEKKYHIDSRRECRAIAGLSMGGYGSSYYALKYPEKFCCLYAMSQAFFNPLTELAMKADKDALPVIYIANGTNDMTVGQSPKQFSELLESCGIEHSYEEWYGGHDWKFWGECIPKFLKAFGKEFNK